MKREFLQNLKIGDQALTAEIIDTIMAENGRDIEAAKKPFADYESIKEQLKTAKDGLAAFKDVDVDQLKGQITTLQGQLTTKDQEWQAKLDGMAFDGKVKDAITAAKGKNAKAIAALLEMDALRSSKNQDADLKAAIEAMKKDNAYLFDDGPTPSQYAPGPGRDPITHQEPTSSRVRSGKSTTRKDDLNYGYHPRRSKGRHGRQGRPADHRYVPAQLPAAGPDDFR